MLEDLNQEHTTYVTNAEHEFELLNHIAKVGPISFDVRYLSNLLLMYIN